MASQRYMIELSNKSKLEIISFCQDHGLIGESYKCPTCGGKMKLAKCNTSDGYQWQCVSTALGSAHHVRRSLRKGTWFSLSKLSLSDILLLTYYWVMEYPQKLVKAEMSIVSNTVVDWYNLCREVCIEVLVRSEHQIGGPGKIVEICESKFGQRKFNHGKKMEGQWVLVGVCRESRQCFVVPVQEDRRSETLLDIIKRKIIPGTVIYSDCWKSYDCSQNKGFDKLAETHSLILNDSGTGCHTNIIEGLWRHFKSTLPDRKRQKLEFNSYLAEYIYRRQMPADENKLFTFFKDIATIYVPQTKDPKTSEDGNQPACRQISEYEMQNQEDFNSDIVKNEPKEELKAEFLGEEFYSEEQETNSDNFSFGETTFKGAECSVAAEIEYVGTKNKIGEEGNLVTERHESKSEERGLFVIQGIKIEEEEISVDYAKSGSQQ